MLPSSRGAGPAGADTDGASPGGGGELISNRSVGAHVDRPRVRIDKGTGNVLSSKASER